MRSNIRTKETLALYKVLLNEKLELKQQKLAFHTHELKNSVSINTLFDNTRIGQELQALKLLSVIEVTNVIYKTTTGKKQTPYLIRLARILVPKILALTKT